jgi:hypothetical protein
VGILLNCTSVRMKTRFATSPSVVQVQPSDAETAKARDPAGHESQSAVSAQHLGCAQAFCHVFLSLSNAERGCPTSKTWGLGDASKLWIEMG